MKYAILPVLALVAACQAQNPGKGTPRSGAPDLASLVPQDSSDSVIHSPRLVTGPTVIVFWLSAGDTLLPEDAAAAYDELSTATEAILPQLTAFDIRLLPTSAETVFVALPNKQRRAILLSGLDYPFGYLLIEPGSPERVLTGTYAEDELQDEISAYFDLPQDTTKTRPRVST